MTHEQLLVSHKHNDYMSPAQTTRDMHHTPTTQVLHKGIAKTLAK